MRWRHAVVIEHVQHHENYKVRVADENPPWTRTAQCDDGSLVTFNWGHLCRDWTHEDNTRVGADVWVMDNGGVSAHKKETV